MHKKLLIAACSMAAALVLLPDTAAAQVADSAKKDTATAAAPMPAATPAPAVNAAASSKAAISDSAIIAMLQLGHTQQIAAAELAISRSGSDRVKRFAEELKTDHGTALAKLQEFAGRMQAREKGMSSGIPGDSARTGRDNNVTGRRDSMPRDSARVAGQPPRHDQMVHKPGTPDSAVVTAPAGAKPEVTLDNVSSLSGHEFDHGFVRLQAEHHETEINHLRNDVIPMIKNSDLKALVQAELTVLGKHLRDARELEAFLKTTN